MCRVRLNARLPAAWQVIAYSPLMQGILVGSYKTADEVCFARTHVAVVCAARRGQDPRVRVYHAKNRSSD